MKTAKELRARVNAAAQGKGPRQRRYPPELKAAAVAYARARQAEGGVGAWLACPGASRRSGSRLC